MQDGFVHIGSSSFPDEKKKEKKKKKKRKEEEREETAGCCNIPGQSEAVSGSTMKLLTMKLMLRTDYNIM